MNDFAYYNVNPNGNEEEDCVTRAIKLATGLSYEAIGKLLDITSYYYNCERLCVNCYGKLLSEIFNYPIRFANFTETVADVIKKYPHNILIIRIDGHLTTAVSGIIADIWDCSKELVDCYWIVT